MEEVKLQLIRERCVRRPESKENRDTKFNLKSRVKRMYQHNKKDKVKKFRKNFALCHQKEMKKPKSMVFEVSNMPTEESEGLEVGQISDASNLNCSLNNDQSSTLENNSGNRQAGTYVKDRISETTENGCNSSLCLNPWAGGTICLNGHHLPVLLQPIILQGTSCDAVFGNLSKLEEAKTCCLSQTQIPIQAQKDRLGQGIQPNIDKSTSDCASALSSVQDINTPVGTSSRQEDPLEKSSSVGLKYIYEELQKLSTVVHSLLKKQSTTHHEILGMAERSPTSGSASTPPHLTPIPAQKDRLGQGILSNIDKSTTDSPVGTSSSQGDPLEKRSSVDLKHIYEELQKLSVTVLSLLKKQSTKHHEVPEMAGRSPTSESTSTPSHLTPANSLGENIQEINLTNQQNDHGQILPVSDGSSKTSSPSKVSEEKSLQVLVKISSSHQEPDQTLNTVHSDLVAELQLDSSTDQRLETVEEPKSQLGEGLSSELKEETLLRKTPSPLAQDPVELINLKQSVSLSSPKRNIQSESKKKVHQHSSVSSSNCAIKENIKNCLTRESFGTALNQPESKSDTSDSTKSATKTPEKEEMLMGEKEEPANESSPKHSFRKSKRPLELPPELRQTRILRPPPTRNPKSGPSVLEILDKEAEKLPTEEDDHDVPEDSPTFPLTQTKRKRLRPQASPPLTLLVQNKNVTSSPLNLSETKSETASEKSGKRLRSTHSTKKLKGVSTQAKPIAMTREKSNVSWTEAPAKAKRSKTDQSKDNVNESVSVVSCNSTSGKMSMACGEDDLKKEQFFNQIQERARKLKMKWLQEKGGDESESSIADVIPPTIATSLPSLKESTDESGTAELTAQTVATVQPSPRKSVGESSIVEQPRSQTISAALLSPGKAKVPSLKKMIKLLGEMLCHEIAKAHDLVVYVILNPWRGFVAKPALKKSGFCLQYDSRSVARALWDLRGGRTQPIDIVEKIMEFNWKDVNLLAFRFMVTLFVTTLSPDAPFVVADTAQGSDDDSKRVKSVARRLVFIATKKIFEGDLILGLGGILHELSALDKTEVNEWIFQHVSESQNWALLGPVAYLKRKESCANTQVVQIKGGLVGVVAVQNIEMGETLLVSYEKLKSVTTQ